MFESGMFPGCFYLLAMYVSVVLVMKITRLNIYDAGGTSALSRRNVIHSSFRRQRWLGRLVVRKVSCSLPSILKKFCCAGLLATAIGKMDGIRGYHGWRWVFILGESIHASSVSRPHANAPFQRAS